MNRLILVVVAAVTLVFVATAAADNWAVSPDISIKKSPTGTTNAGSKVLVYGKVSSSKRLCKEDRTVKLFRVKQGSDPLVAKDLTDADGEYGFARHPNNDQKFYTTIRSMHQVSYGHDHLCRKARSDNKKV